MEMLSDARAAIPCIVAGKLQISLAVCPYSIHLLMRCLLSGCRLPHHSVALVQNAPRGFSCVALRSGARAARLNALPVFGKSPNVGRFRAGAAHLNRELLIKTSPNSASK